MSNYTFAFALTTALGNRTRYETLRRHACCDEDVEFVWAPVAHYLEPDPYQHWPEPIHTQRVLNHEAREIFVNWGRLDAVVVHAFQLFAYLSMYRAVRPGRSPILVCSQDYAPFRDPTMLVNYGHDVQNGLRRRMRFHVEAWFTRRADLHVPFSHWAERLLIDDSHVPVDNVHVIHPGVDLDYWHPVRRNRDAGAPLRILFVGGDFYRKGGDLLVEAFGQMDRSAQLDIVTREPIDHLPDGAVVHTHLSADDQQLRDLYSACDVFALPTRADMSSHVALEAMATGRPVISTAIGGIPDIVRDGETGLLIQPDDSTALVYALRRLADDPALRELLGRNGRSVVERDFSAASNTHRLLALLKERVDATR